jgi:tetratricopeptide (TPR) repeat protein
LDLDVVEGLASLMDKSLVRQETGPDGEPRFLLLRTIAEYAGEKLEEAGEMVALRSAHAQYYQTWAIEADAGFTGGEPALWLQRLDLNYNNLRTALDTLLQDQGSDLGLQLATALRRYWMVRGPVSEARKFLARVLSHPSAASRSRRRAALLQVAASLARRQSDYAAAEAMGLESLAIVRELGDSAAIATVLMNMGNLYCELDDYARARALHEEALAIQRSLKDQYQVALALDSLGVTVGILGEQELSRTYHAEALEIARELNDPLLISYAATNLGTRYILLGEPAAARPLIDEALALQRQLELSDAAAINLAALGSVATDAGDFAQARSYFTEALALSRAEENMRGLYYRLLAFAELAVAQKQPERAARLWGAAESHGERTGVSMDVEGRALNDELIARARTQTDEASFALAWAAGRSLSLEQAIAYALEEGV